MARSRSWAAVSWSAGSPSRTSSTSTSSLIHPLILGQEQRLFADAGPRRELRLTDSVVTTTGVVIATYDARPGPSA
jgi:hypothetical protein